MMVRRTDFSQPVAPATSAQLVQSFRDVWSPRSGRGLPSNSYSASVGGSDRLLGQQLGYVLSGTYSYSQEVLADYARGQALAGDQRGQVNAVDRYDGAVGRAGVLWGGVANLSTLVGARTRVSLNNTYNRTADDEGRTERGFSENLGTALDVRRLRYVERSVRSNQLALQHTAGTRHQIDAYVTSSGVTRSEPDRSEFVQAIQTDPATGRQLAPAWLSLNSEGAVRTFGDLSERNVETALNYRLALGAPGREWAFKLGGLYRNTDRDARNDVYSLVANLSQDQRQQAPETIFSSVAAQAPAGTFNIIPLSQGGSYEASERVAAGYAMADAQVTGRIRVIGGARLERSDTRVLAQPTVGGRVRTSPWFQDLLPSLAVNLQLTANQQLRVSGSQTLARPEYRELAPIQFRDVIGGDNVIGNALLRRSLIRSADVRWEWYPSAGEVLSVAAFGKFFDDPIERLYLATSGTRVVTFANADKATNYGLEFEARKGLGFAGAAFEPFSAFSNVTLIRSDIALGAAGASLSSTNRAMVGQAPYVVNAGLSYAAPRGASATLLYNVVGERIVNAAEAPLPDVRERPRNVLDFSVRAPLTGAVSVRLDARNLLDAPYQLFQGSALRERYRTGRIVQLGFTWRPGFGPFATPIPSQGPR
jgi:TonB-dependent receptor